MIHKHSNPLILFLFILKTFVYDGRQLQYMSNWMFIIYYTYIILHLFILFFSTAFIFYCVHKSETITRPAST